MECAYGVMMDATSERLSQVIKSESFGNESTANVMEDEISENGFQAIKRERVDIEIAVDVIMDETSDSVSEELINECFATEITIIVMGEHSSQNVSPLIKEEWLDPEITVNRLEDETSESVSQVVKRESIDTVITVNVMEGETSESVFQVVKRENIDTEITDNVMEDETSESVTQVIKEECLDTEITVHVMEDETSESVSEVIEKDCVDTEKTVDVMEDKSSESLSLIIGKEFFDTEFPEITLQEELNLDALTEEPYIMEDEISKYTSPLVKRRFKKKYLGTKFPEKPIQQLNLEENHNLTQSTFTDDNFSKSLQVKKKEYKIKTLEYIKNKKNYKFSCCKFCGRLFLRMAHVRRHQQIKHRNRIITSINCEYCKKKFWTERELFMHENRRHLNEKLRKCPFCDKRFRLNGRRKFNRHVKTHAYGYKKEGKE